MPSTQASFSVLRRSIGCMAAKKSTLYTEHFTLHTSQFTLHTLYSTRSALYTPHSTLCTSHIPHCTLYTLHFTHHTLHFTLDTLHSTLQTVHSELDTVHSALYTLNSTLYTPQVTLHTPHWTVRTPHFTHYILRDSVFSSLSDVHSGSLVSLAFFDSFKIPKAHEVYNPKNMWFGCGLRIFKSSKEVWKLNFRQYRQMEKHHSHGEEQRWRK